MVVSFNILSVSGNNNYNASFVSRLLVYDIVVVRHVLQFNILHCTL